MKMFGLIDIAIGGHVLHCIGTGLQTNLNVKIVARAIDLLSSLIL